MDRLYLSTSAQSFLSFFGWDIWPYPACKPTDILSGRVKPIECYFEQYSRIQNKRETFIIRFCFLSSWDIYSFFCFWRCASVITGIHIEGKPWSKTTSVRQLFYFLLCFVDRFWLAWEQRRETFLGTELKIAANFFFVYFSTSVVSDRSIFPLLLHEWDWANFQLNVYVCVCILVPVCVPFSVSLSLLLLLLHFVSFQGGITEKYSYRNDFFKYI